MRQFNARVNATTGSFDERLNYLLQFTTGEAYKIVLGYSHLNAEMGFNAALAEFKERYGDPDVIAYEYVKRALDWPQIKSDNSKGLDEFGIFLRECQFVVENVEAARVFEYSDNLKLLMKLPFFLHEKWRNIVFETKRKGYVIKFSQLVDFVRQEAKKANDPIFGREHISARDTKKSTSDKKGGKGSNHSKLFTTQVSEQCSPKSSDTFQKKVDESKMLKKGLAFINPCLFCNSDSHSLEQCSVIRESLVKERYEFLKSKGLCFGCLRSGHMKGSCKKKLVCPVCNKFHPFILHADQRSESTSNEVKATFTSNLGARKKILPIVPVRVKHKSSHTYIDTYAFLDSGSTATFCTESLMHRLSLEGKRTMVTLHTMGKRSNRQMLPIDRVGIM